MSVPPAPERSRDDDIDPEVLVRALLQISPEDAEEVRRETAERGSDRQRLEQGPNG